MQRQTRKPPTTSKSSRKREASNAMAQQCVPQATGPFTTFTEWWSEADEKAYAEL
jgi:hypothetical protein